jgi:hypothetical protein
MNTGKILAAITFAALAAAPLSAGAGNTLVYGNVSAWTVRTDPAQAYRCFAEVQYVDGTSMRVGYNTEGGALYLEIADPAWSSLGTAKGLPVALTFDDETTFELSGDALIVDEAAGLRGIHVRIPAASRESFVKNFVEKYAISLSVADQAPVELSLAASYRATIMLGDCQSSMTSS